MGDYYAAVKTNKNKKNSFPTRDIEKIKVLHGSVD